MAGKLAALTALAVIICGCGSQVQSASSIKETAAHMRAETTQSVQFISRGVEEVHAGELVELGAAYVGCQANSTEMRYSQTMVVRPGRRTSVPALASSLVSAMRIIGWQVRSVNMANMNVPIGTPHPLYYFSHVDATGAMNVLPYAETGSEAIMFVNSPCFDAQSMYQALEHEG
jgi:hypothetical protein